ncbi:cell wall-binding repeat-containing protein [Microbacterium sp. A588]
MSKARVLAFVLSALIISSAAAVVSTPAYAGTAASRIAGSDRYETAAAVSQAAFGDPKAVEVVFVTTGASFADSLSAGPVATVRNAPVLLAHNNGLPRATIDELRRLSPKEIVIVGGTGVISRSVGDQLKSYAATVTRTGGADRYDTSRLVVEQGFPNGTGTVYVTAGRTFADAVSGGALAAAKSAPLLLIDPALPRLDAATKQTLGKLGASRLVVIGGQGALSSALAQEAAAVTGAKPSRLGGADRYETSAVVAGEFGVIDEVLLATGTDFPDAISAIPLAARRGAPVVLTIPYCVSTTTARITSQPSVKTLTLIGGVGALRGLVGNQHGCLSTTDPHSPWLVVNKKRPLPSSHEPADMRPVNVRNVGGGWMRREAAGALEQLFAHASAEGAGAMGNASAHRSYSYQQQLFDSAVRRKGIAQAEIDTARPGFSEHQSGMAIDVVACGNGCGSIYGFGGTPQSRWVNDNAHRFGFIVRYEPGYQHIAGYMSEPWHLRYVGAALATDYKAGGFHTLEQYFGLPAAPHY